MILKDVKTLLDIQTDEIDDKLNVIIEIVQRRLCRLLAVKDVPEELEYIITEVSVKRFNRVGSEGLSTHTVEGETSVFANEFEDYKEDIESYLAEHHSENAKVVRFI